MTCLFRNETDFSRGTIIVSWNQDSSSSSRTNLFHGPKMAQSLSPSVILITLLPFLNKGLPTSYNIREIV